MDGRLTNGRLGWQDQADCVDRLLTILSELLRDSPAERALKIETRFPVGSVVPPLVLACGCFDLLTIGHVRHLQAASKLGRTLCVLVTADERVAKPGRPILPENERLEMVRALDCVSFAVINHCPTAVPWILSLRPQVYAKGKDYFRFPISPGLAAEIEAADRVGARVEFTDTKETHTSEIIAKITKAVI